MIPVYTVHRYWSHGRREAACLRMAMIARAPTTHATLETLFQYLAKDPQVKEVSSLAHSMGNWLALESLRQMAIRNGQTLTDSRVGLGDQMFVATTGAAAAAGNVAGLVLAAPVAVVDQNTHDNYSSHVGSFAKASTRPTPPTDCDLNRPTPGCKRLASADDTVTYMTTTGILLHALTCSKDRRFRITHMG